MILLYIDVLGMKNRWKTGGPDAAKAAHRTLELVVQHAIESTPYPERVSGGVQSDAVALKLHSVVEAVSLGESIFREAFRRSGSLEVGHERFWIRGVIRQSSTSDLESTDVLGGAASGVAKRKFSDDLMEAIHVEQSGYRGQRLLIQESLIDPALSAEFSTEVGTGRFYRLASLRYVHSISGYRDVLWMFPPNPGEELDDELRLMNIAMQNRLRWSSEGGPDEFVQAAATQLVFAECQTIYSHLLEQ